MTGLVLKDYGNDKGDIDLRMQALMALPKATYIEDARQTFDPQTAVAVDMHEGGVTLPDAQYPALGTTALATCIGVVAHNTQTKATGLCHIVSDGIASHPSLDSQVSFAAMLNKVKNGMDTQIEVRLVGAHMGGEMQNGIINHIVDILSDYDAVILSADIKGKPGPMEVAVDSSRWDDGLMRGKTDVVDLRNNPNALIEKLEQTQSCVDLDQMVRLPDNGNDLIYDATAAQSCDLDITL
ncbi:MAG: hypothetical protein COA45_07980 [Zetaproteobacteria bacterium]|nr:MAG: hypothetical protein COA45_07980 [Zetaproteobacteria bacterium]